MNQGPGTTSWKVEYLKIVTTDFDKIVVKCNSLCVKPHMNITAEKLEMIKVH